MVKLTRQAAQFVSTLDAKHLPPRCVEAARTGVIDCIGVMVAGADERAVRIVSAMLPTATSNRASREVPSGRALSSPDAALVNGVAAHVLDYDDVALDGHPSAVLVPAIVAEGWTLESSGADVLAAYAAGYELWAALIALELGHLHDRGFHPTGVIGALAAAAACARLHRLGPDKTTHALAIAASLAAGLVANFGTMTKSLHAGRAAQSGVLAARLARDGLTGALDALEHPTGFIRAHSTIDPTDLDTSDLGLGVNWRLADIGVNIKRYPTCYATHRAIDAMIDLARSRDLDPDAVAEVHVRTGRTQLLMLRNSQPRTALEAKFSMQFALAAALISRRVGLPELTDEYVLRPEVVANGAKVRCTTTDQAMETLPFAPDDRVSVVLHDGTIIEHAPVTHAKGSWALPLTRDELEEKFFDCATRRLPQGQARKLFDQLWSIIDLRSVCELELNERPSLS
ncbi:MAG: MmgE/PrpD family protein [Hyphomonadaceae bacterium]|nr:MmgE/PrpD family protein [Hyphomonadaceae bacterium]